jgi:hypothetical protein
MPPAPHLTCTAARPSEAAPFSPEWRSETAVALARGIVLDSALDRLPILADALEEAGCDDAVLLRHCRECPRHRALCWVLGDLFDRPPPVDAPRMTDAEVRREVERVTGRPVLPASEDPWGGRVPARLWFFRALPAVVAGLVVSWLAWASVAPPATGRTQFTSPAMLVPPSTATSPR